MINLSPKQAVQYIVVMNLILFVIYSETLMQLFDFWSTSYNYSHGIILFPIVMGIYFYEFYRQPSISVQYINRYTIILVLACVSVWFLADLLNIQFVEFLAFLCLLISLNFLLTSASLKDSYNLWPLFLIIFTLPLLDSLLDILRTLETPVVVLFLNMSFIDAVQDGFLIYIPAGTFLVERACSGFNQFVVSIPLAALYIYSRKLKFSKMYKFFLLLLLLAMLFNIVRIYIIVVAGQVSHMKSSLLNDHEYLAWLIYGIGVFILFYFTDRKVNNNPTQFAKVSKVDIHTLSVNKKTTAYGALVVVCLLLIGPLSSLVYSNVKNTALINIDKLVENLHWKKSEHQDSFSPNYDKGDLVYQNKLENFFGKSVNLYINHFVNQEQGREAINGVSNLVDSKKGEILNQTRRLVVINNSTQMYVNELIIQLKNRKKYIAWQWYYTNGKHLTKSLDARLNNLLAMLKNKPSISNVVISREIKASESASREVLKLFLSDNIGVMKKNIDIRAEN